MKQNTFWLNSLLFRININRVAGIYKKKKKLFQRIMSSSKKISSSPTPQQHLPSPPPIPKFYDYENCAIYKETPRFSPIPPPNSSSNSRGRLERINPSRQQDPSSRSFAGGREGSNSNSSSSSTHRVQPYPLSSSRGAGGELSRSNPPPVFRSDKLIPHSMPFDWISSSSKQQQQQQQLEKIDFKIMLLDKNQLLLGNDDQITTCNNNIAKFCHKGTVDKLIKARVRTELYYKTQKMVSSSFCFSSLIYTQASLSSSISNTDYIRAR